MVSFQILIGSFFIGICLHGSFSQVESKLLEYRNYLLHFYLLLSPIRDM